MFDPRQAMQAAAAQNQSYMDYMKRKRAAQQEQQKGGLSSMMGNVLGGATEGLTPGSPEMSRALLGMKAPDAPAATPATFTPPTSTLAGSIAGLDGMADDYITAFNSLYTAMPENLRNAGFGINSGYRSPEHQARIITDHFPKYGFSDADLAAWNADLEALGPIAAGAKWGDRFSASGMRKYIALPGKSNHQFGRAGDVWYGSPDVKAWIHANAPLHGLAFPMSWEPWHMELAGIRG